MPAACLVILGLSIFGAACSTTLVSKAHADYQASPTTQIVFLGTGTPNPDPDRSGPSVAIIVNDTPYIVDFGAGLLRRAAESSPRYGGTVAGLDAKRIKRAFLTHLHADHTIGFADLILTPWIMGRDEPLEVYGPEGIDSMAEHLLKAYEEDIRYRIYGAERANDRGWRVNTHEIKQGIVYKDKNVTVEAFAVRHGAWPNAFGYRFSTPDRVIVVSGDTTLDPNLEKFASNADILIHEVYSSAGVQKSSPEWRSYMQANHTSTEELAGLATRIKPDLLLLYHVLFLGVEGKDLVAEINKTYSGQTILASDLDVY